MTDAGFQSTWVGPYYSMSRETCLSAQGLGNGERTQWVGRTRCPRVSQAPGRVRPTVQLATKIDLRTHLQKPQTPRSWELS